MKVIKTHLLPVMAAMLWISLSEFVRNQWWFSSLWTEHYQHMNLTFPAEPLNGAVWGIWALVFACVLHVLSSKFSFLQTCLLGWLIGFVMMWLVIGNLGVLPFGLLVYAIPLSLLEVVLAVWIDRKLTP